MIVNYKQNKSIPVSVWKFASSLSETVTFCCPAEDRKNFALDLWIRGLQFFLELTDRFYFNSSFPSRDYESFSCRRNCRLRMEDSCLTVGKTLFYLGVNG
jgi:hypothetical protein